MDYKKHYRTSTLDFIRSIIRAHFNDWNVVLDKKIEPVTVLLSAYGFSTIGSCEGHLPGNGHVNAFRQFWPYVQINLIHKRMFDHEEGRTSLSAVSDTFRTLQRLENLVTEFNCTNHPFSIEHSELAVLPIKTITTTPSVLHILRAQEKHYSMNVLVCDKGVAGILSMPQELLTVDLRRRFIKRTQKQMELFGKFLEWYAIEDEKRELFFP